MRRAVLAALVAAACCAAPSPALAQVVPLPTETPEPTATPSPTPAGGQAPPVAVPTPGLSAVAVRQDPARSGSSGDATLAGPLGTAWAVDAGGGVRTLVTGGGRVYADVIGLSESGPASAAIVAFDAASGRRLWSVPFGGGLAYGDERLAVVTAGELRILDAGSGATVWTASSGSTDLGDVLVAGGVVLHHVGSSPPNLQALSLADGSKLWQTSENGTSGVPAVAGDRVFTAEACAAAALDRRTGATLWQVRAGCSGAGSSLALWNDRVLPRAIGEFGPLAAADGARLDGPAPQVVTGDVGLSVEDTRVRAVRLPSGTPLWDAPGGAPLGLPGAVATRTEGGRIAVLDANTGAEIWAGQVKDPVMVPSGVWVLRDLVAGEGRLYVVNGASLLALAPQGSVPGSASELRSTVGPAGRPFRVRGTIAGPVLPSTAQLELRTGKAWRPVATVRPGLEGAVRPQVTLRRNAVARLAGPGLAPSRPVRLYAQPVIRTRIVAPRPGGRVTARMRLRAVPGLGRAGRRVALYVVRGRSRTYRRLGTTRVGRDGRGVVRFAPLSARGGRIFVASCLVGARRLRLGGPDPFTRRCGRARITIPRR